jgi:prepilin-type N-terminal cleavage/methylation domain-containing protein
MMTFWILDFGIEGREQDRRLGIMCQRILHLGIADLGLKDGFRRRSQSKIQNPKSKIPRGFTLIELLVVILIILIVSAVALPVVLPAMSHREVREAARLVQGTLVGARDSALHNNQPSGIRLLPDPTFLTESTKLGQVDPSQILVANRIIPLDPPPEYSEGYCTPVTAGSMKQLTTLVGQPTNWPANVPYPVQMPLGTTSYYTLPLAIPGLPRPGQCLMLLENFVNPKMLPLAPNPPTSWSWNIRIGDRLQLNNAGPWYTVVGPMTVANPELFVNTGVPGDTSQWPQFAGQPVEYLLLVNGQDDNSPPNGWIDEGWDGVDNNGNGYTDEIAEWETEEWLGSLSTATVVDLPYTIQRRPAPSPNARELALPTNVVIDLTGWGSFVNASGQTVPAPLERSRVPGPMFNQFTGYVDIVLNPDGTVRPSTVYSSPSSFGMGSSFVHLWLAERSDLAAPSQTQTTNPFLPLPQGLAPALFSGQPAPFSGQEIKGEYSLITLFTRTGQLVSNSDMPFLFNLSAGGFTNNPPLGPNPFQYYNHNYPYIQAQQGVQGGSQ